MGFIRLTLVGLLATTSVTSALAGDLKSVSESCHLKGFREPLRCAQVTVPADYQRPDENQYEIFVAIAPSLRENAKPDPVFVLAGGPGQSGSSIIHLLSNAMQKLRATRDIVFIDQRGTGRSGKLDCPNLKDQMFSLDEQQSVAMFRKCVESHAVDFSHYTTANAARDLDKIREQLGYNQINLWGGSYGTRLAQTYARLFPENTRALILDGVASPEQVLAVWSKDAQAALDKLFQQCAQDDDCRAEFPNLQQDFVNAATNIKAGIPPVRLRHPRTGEWIDVPLTYEIFADTVRTTLYSPTTMAALPQLIHLAAEGNWQPMVTALLTYSEWTQDAMAILLTFSVACAEDVPYIDEATIESERASGFLEGLQARTWPQLCQQVPVNAVERHSTETIAAPTLLLSGAYDPVTPPWRAEQAMQHISSDQHIVVPQLSHGISNVGCAPKLLRDFLDKPTDKVDDACLQSTRFPPFVVSAAGPRP